MLRTKSVHSKCSRANDDMDRTQPLSILQRLVGRIPTRAGKLQTVNHVRTQNLQKGKTTHLLLRQEMSISNEKRKQQ